MYCLETFLKMITDNVGRMVYNEDDLVDMIMHGRLVVNELRDIIVDGSVDIESAALLLNNVPTFIRYDTLAQESTEQFDHRCQNNWFMPEEYKQLDIAEYVLGLCKSDAELQRCGEELLLFQERDLFNLLRYLKYIVDLMMENRLIWGVGRGSSVASFVLYKLGVHKIDSLHYDLDPSEFLR